MDSKTLASLKVKWGSYPMYNTVTISLQFRTTLHCCSETKLNITLRLKTSNQNCRAQY